jgi:hypothetical protein
VNAMINTNYDQRTARMSLPQSAFLAAALVFLLPAFVASALVTDQIGAESRRELVDINTYPWSSIGKVGIPDFRAVNACTAAVIGPNQFVTAGHCLYNARIGRFVAAGGRSYQSGHIGRGLGCCGLRRTISRRYTAIAIGDRNALARHGSENWRP